MKKLLAIILALAMVLSLAACGDSGAREPNEPNDAVGGGDNNAEDGTPDVFDVPENNGDEDENPLTSAVDAIGLVWEAFPEDMKPMTFGGDYENNAENEPYEHTIADGGAELDGSIGYPADLIDKIGEAAALRHMLNVNTFTCGAYSVLSADDVQAVCDGIEYSLMHRSYICGAPQQLVIMVVQNTFVISVFGAEDLVTTFKDTALEVYGDKVTVVYDESMEGAHGDNGIAIPQLG